MTDAEHEELVQIRTVVERDLNDAQRIVFRNGW